MSKKNKSLKLPNIRDETRTLSELNSLFDNSDILSAVGADNLTAATYYACMLIRCNALAKIPFKIYRSRSKSTVQTVTGLNLCKTII